VIIKRPAWRAKRMSELGKPSIKAQRLVSWLFFVVLCLISAKGALWLRGGTDASVFAVLDSLSRDFQNWFADQEDAKLAVVHLPSTLATSPQLQSIANRRHGSVSREQAAALDHTANDSQVCRRPPSKPRSDTSAQQIYKWTDEDGQTHMSDSRPEDRIASVVDLGMAKQDFTYEIIPDGMTLPIDFPGQLAAGSKRMYDTWHFFLGEENLRQSRIQLLLMGDPDRFDAYYANGSAVSRKVAGFYRMGKNQAVVNYDPKRPAKNLGTTFHEVSHLITAAHLGPTPPWLTEGLAEYFETMRVKGQGGVIYPNQAHIKRLKSMPLPRLQDYLTLDRPAWYGEDRSRNYAIAWSLMHFLMKGAPGMYALQETVRQAQVNFCRTFSAADALGKAYPGGIRQLEADWRKWLASRNFQAHQT
jgi:hypothetical protein